MTTATIRRTLRETFGKGHVRISTGGAVRVYGPLPVDPAVTGWYLYGRIVDGALEPLAASSEVPMEKAELGEQLLALEPLFDKETLFDAEDGSSSNAVLRRMAFMIGTKTGSELMELVGEDTNPDVLANLLYAARQTKARTEDMLKISDICLTRFDLFLHARGDVKEIEAIADRMALEDDSAH